MCRILKISRSSYYDWIKADQSTANAKDAVFENLLQQDFSTTEFSKVWLTDITYIRTGGKWSNLAAVIDLACKVLKMALEKEKPSKGLIHHSDRGNQYTSKEYRKLLEENQIIDSMSRKGNPYDNAPMESFFHLLKVEHVNKRCVSTLKEAVISINKWFSYCITRRSHSALGGISPLAYEIKRNHTFVMSA